MFSGRLSWADMGNPRAATASATSTRRSIHISWCLRCASGSRVSQNTGSAGPTRAVTVSAMVECEATMDHSSRAVRSVTAMIRSTAISCRSQR
jgi:hypothetical protein